MDYTEKEVAQIFDELVIKKPSLIKRTLVRLKNKKASANAIKKVAKKKEEETLVAEKNLSLMNEEKLKAIEEKKKFDVEEAQKRADETIKAENKKIDEMVTARVAKALSEMNIVTPEEKATEVTEKKKK